MKRRISVWAFLALSCGKNETASIGTDAALDPGTGVPATDGGAPGTDEGAAARPDATAASVDVGRASADSPGTTAEVGGRDFAAITGLLEQRAAQAGVGSMGLAIWDARDSKIYQHMLGDFTPDTRVAVASASKLVSGLVIFDVIRRGLASLETTTGEILGWPTPNASISLRHLLSFTSGLPSDATCTVNPLTTLARCADTLATATPVAAPGAEFDYGSTHLLVAGAMAEQVTGQRWNDLFAQTLQVPLGLPSDVAYFTGPRQAVGQINPLIAGGLRASMNEYRHFLAIAFHKGSYAGLTIGTTALYDQQAREPFPDAAIGSSPMPSFRYGLACWLDCATPKTGCEQLASPGAFGFTPWLDRAAGYYAILGMQLESTGSDEGVVAFAVSLQTELVPLIQAEMAQ
jgi:serine-type D-Ala-D-Ala carboxypeptidase/endopeptidase